MTLTIQSILAMVGRTLTGPREGAEEVLALGIPRQGLWMALVLVAVLSAILGQITTFLMVGVEGAAAAGLMGQPILTGLIQLVVLVGSVLAIYHIGRAFGGTGSFDEVVAVVVWLQFVMVCVQVLQTAMMILVPPVGGLIGLLAIVLFMWLLTHFIAVVHGFRSLGQVFVMILLSMFAIAFALSIVLSVIGVSPMDLTT